jgi:hypothetical protein
MAATFSLAARCGAEMLGTALAVGIGNAAIANHVLGYTKGHGMGFGWVAAAYGLGFSLVEVRAWALGRQKNQLLALTLSSLCPPNWHRDVLAPLAQVVFARISNFLNPAVAIGFAVAGELAWPAFFAIAFAEVGLGAVPVPGWLRLEWAGLRALPRCASRYRPRGACVLDRGRPRRLGEAALSSACRRAAWRAA